MNKEAPAENRPKYRAGRKPTAVKVYTVNQESRYLVVENVPSIGVTKELLELFALYGTVEEYRYLDDYPCEEFTDVYWIKYRSLVESRVAKRKLDDHVFFSSPLSVRYGPEYESIQDTREKLQDRRTVVAIKTQSSSSSIPSSSTTEQRQQQLKSTNIQTRDNTINNYYTATVTSQPPLPPDPPPPPIFPQPDPNAYYNFPPQGYYPSSSQYSSYMSYKSNEPPIPGIGYIATAPPSRHKEESSNEPISSTVLNIREKIKDASSVNLPSQTNQIRSTETNIPTTSSLSSSATNTTRIDTNTSPPVKKRKRI
ncbi:11381_t:CDS:2 [Ambispora gerdemannii]|uniref:RNA-binding protein 48 n=1 Tax=Ambispora gerdemannii TaxID=144530 RepID=A0A9N8VZL6_9GLOM|nr:11381_t:CDS:2 [Ambispora gerdemannii]